MGIFANNWPWTRESTVAFFRSRGQVGERNRIGHDRAFRRFSEPKVRGDLGIWSSAGSWQYLSKGPREMSPGAPGRRWRWGASVRGREGWVFGAFSLPLRAHVHTWWAKEESHSALVHEPDTLGLHPGCHLLAMSFHLTFLWLSSLIIK